MSRPRVLCASADRTTRASITLSLTDAPVDVVIAHGSSDAVARLEGESIDAVLVDGRTIEDVPTIVSTVQTIESDVPVFVHWTDGDDAVAVLDEVNVETDDGGSASRIADVVTARIEAGTEPAVTEPVDAIDAQPADERERIVDAVRRELADVRSPLTVERVLREAFTASSRFLFAWVGEYDRGEREIVPWLSASAEMECPLRRTFAVGDDEYPLLDRAIRSRSLQVAQPLENDLDGVPFGSRTRERGVEAVAVAPLTSSGERYGVFVVYALEALSGADRDAIRSAADVASHALETIAVHGRLEQRERALQRYEQLVETAGDGMYVFDDEGHFMTVNDALVEMTGYSREGLLGEHASMLVDDESVEAGEETIRSLLDANPDRTTDTVELSLETKDGETIPCEAQVAIIVRDQTFLGSVGVVRDITERKRRERKLRQRNERLDAFARIVSHDLRNPLSVSQGYLDVIEETDSLEHVENVRGGLDRMESIIEDVLAIARGGEWASEIESIDLESAADDAWEHVTTDRAELSVAETMTVEADRPRLLRLLENLFRNAIEHGRSGSDSTVRVRIGSLESDDGHRSGFYVEDDGDGIPDDVKETLFDPSVSSSAAGLGIGLWVVREVATGHDWSVTAVESESGGARFEFEFDDSSSNGDA
ncbi:PAS domain S-box protein [Natrarchaeobius oligotrophus]|uniref:histidine kinase n=1 Tax=Natrarchaeobius chitinivorans TaxID=1679083 RepID=A0A3N6MYB6_NATCH|nr:PAS domain S-box protein [Natrarchaeobius chitinivorans]RQH01462.1 PAS domain S-box protein [Natrarchaeobius chitinivorans]